METVALDQRGPVGSEREAEEHDDEHAEEPNVDLFHQLRDPQCDDRFPRRSCYEGVMEKFRRNSVDSEEHDAETGTGEECVLGDFYPYLWSTAHDRTAKK